MFQNNRDLLRFRKKGNGISRMDRMTTIYPEYLKEDFSISISKVRKECAAKFHFNKIKKKKKEKQQNSMRKHCSSVSSLWLIPEI